jgi:hypothetical protein
MINHTGIAILLLISPLLSPLSLAGDSADAVNERLPVSKAEMEAHWQVDCAAAWEQLLAAAAQPTKQPTNTDNCGIPGQLRREIQLCAFIYQAPGGAPGQDCPDYRGVSEQLNEADKTGKCRVSILQKADCQPGSQ